MKKTNDKPKTEFFIRSCDYGVEDGKRTIKGLIPYNSDSVDMYGVTERIMPTAFNKTLADHAEVKCLFGHDTTKILGSSGAGTLRMTSESDGLHFEVDLPNTTDGNDAYELISRGDCRTLSFGFVPVKTNYKLDETGNDNDIRELVEVKLLEISICVAFPAYPEGNTSVRSFFKECGMDFDELNNILKRETLSEDDKHKLNTIAEKLTALTRSAETGQQSKDTENATEEKEAEEKAKAEAEKEAKEREETNRRERFVYFAQNQE